MDGGGAQTFQAPHGRTGAHKPSPKKNAIQSEGREFSESSQKIFSRGIVRAAAGQSQPNVGVHFGGPLDDVHWNE